MLFCIHALDKPGSQDLRLATRQAHLDYAHGGAVKLGGPLLDEAGEMVGSLIVIEAADLAAAKAWSADDPYTKAGLFAEVQIRPWRWVVGNPDA
ncbi:MAG: YciI family protein [Pseudomonadota bacterium]